jgi:hypothetical protein
MKIKIRNPNLKRRNLNYKINKTLFILRLHDTAP